MEMEKPNADDTVNDNEEELPDIDDLPPDMPTSFPIDGSKFSPVVRQVHFAPSSIVYEDSGESFDASLPSTSKGLGSSGKKMPAVSAVKDSDGFLAPPPASTLLIRRTRTSSTSGSTYVVTPTTSDGSEGPPVKKSMSLDDGTQGTDDRNQFFEPDFHDPDFFGGEFSGGSGAGKRMKNYRNISKLKHDMRGRKRMFNRVGKIKDKLKVRKPVNIDPNTGKRRYRKRKSLPFSMQQQNKRNGEDSDLGSVKPMRSEFDRTREVVSLTWRPIDDLRLIVNTLQTNDLKQVHMGVKFSCRYTLQEIKNRWRNLLYDEKISKVAMTACRNIHSKVKRRIYANALFSEAELQTLQSVRSTSNPNLSKFEELLRDNVSVFHEARTAKDLQRCWVELKEINMLDDQDIKKNFERGSENFADFESSVSDEDVRNLNIDPAVMQEILHEERRNKKRIRILEQEISAWQSLADLVLEGQIVKAPEFDDNTFALIRGKNVRFAMAAKEITLGRRTRDNWVDADLSEEGNDTKISRRQATIKMRALGDFVILNQGKHPMYIDGQALLSGEVASLHDQSVIRVSKLNFVFIVNDKLLQDLRKKILEEESNAEHVEIPDTSIPTAVTQSPIRPVSTPKSKGKERSPFQEGPGKGKSSKAEGSSTPKSRKTASPKPPKAVKTPTDPTNQTPPGPDGKTKQPAKKNPPKRSAPKEPRKPKPKAAAEKSNKVNSNLNLSSTKNNTTLALPPPPTFPSSKTPGPPVSTLNSNSSIPVSMMSPINPPVPTTSTFIIPSSTTVSVPPSYTTMSLVRPPVTTSLPPTYTSTPIFIPSTPTYVSGPSSSSSMPLTPQTYVSAPTPPVPQYLVGIQPPATPMSVPSVPTVAPVSSSLEGFPPSSPCGVSSSLSSSQVLPPLPSLSGVSSSLSSSSLQALPLPLPSVSGVEPMVHTAGHSVTAANSSYSQASSSSSMPSSSGATLIDPPGTGGNGSKSTFPPFIPALQDSSKGPL